MQIAIIGGGPAGLYFALLMKKADSQHDITVVERNRPDDTFGWGVVFSDQTLQNMKGADRETHDEIRDSFIHWDNIDVHFKGQTISSSGHGFSGIGRLRLLNILQNRAQSLGVNLCFQREVIDDSAYAHADLIVAADGANSGIRRKYSEFFKPQVETRRCKYIWLGTRQRFDAFTFAFAETEWGWFQAHAYRFDDNTSTFIVETPQENWLKAGLDKLTTADSVAFCEKLFAPYLDGHRLISNASHLKSPWVNFLRVTNEAWSHKQIVLLGDAAHTAHFSIGSGTKLALEDAISLVGALRKPTDLPSALQEYEAERKVEVLKLQNAARNSTEWFENVKRYTHLEAEQFAYSLLTRSQRISHENLRMRDKAYVARVESWLAQHSGLAPKPIPPMFTPFTLRGITVPNRVAVSPMAMYSCVDGTPDDFYLVHLGSRAHGGAGLVFTEMTCVSPDARITPGCAGMYRPEHKSAWRHIVEYVHRQTPAKIAMQLGHAGPKGSTQLGWENEHEPLIDPAANWPLLAASAVQYGPHNQVPRALTRDDMNQVTADFVRAARWASECDFDWLELHCAHGYLLSSFISPLSNIRDDAYGGSLQNRCRFPLEVFESIRAVWPTEKPMSVRISAHDWTPDGNTDDDAVEIARWFKSAGADLIDVSSGQTSRQAKPVYGRMYQTPFSDRIRNEVDIATMAVGAIFEPDHVNSIIAAGRADLCALGRPHLADPYWTLHAAAQLGYKDEAWPKQYLNGKAQLERNLSRSGQG